MTYRGNPPSGLPYQPGRGDPLVAALAMVQAGLLSQAAMRAIAYFSEHEGETPMVACHWDSANQRGLIGYRGVIYTPAGFNRLWAAPGSLDGPEDSLSMAPLPPAPSPALPPALGDELMHGSAPSPCGARWTRLGCLFDWLACLGLFLAPLATLAVLGWLLVSWLHQLVTLLLTGFLNLLGR